MVKYISHSKKKPEVDLLHKRANSSEKVDPQSGYGPKACEEKETNTRYFFLHHHNFLHLHILKIFHFFLCSLSESLV